MSSKKLTVSMTDPNEIQMTRTFDAPRKLVIRAMTTPELVKRWLGGKRTTVTAVEIDLRVGGAYRYAFRNPDGSEFFFVGEYKALGDDRVEFTQLFNGDPPPALVTTTYAESAGKTTMTVTMRLPSQEIRDMIAATGMADGAGESYDALEELMASL